MHGSGTTPPVRTDGVVITMRVLFPLCAVFSCGILSCVPLFRIAILRGRWYDWVAAWGSLPLAITAFGVVGALPEGDVRTDIALSFVLLLGAATAGYFLVFDIRHYARLQTAGVPHSVTGSRVPYSPYVQQQQQQPQQPRPPYGHAHTPQPQYGYPNPYASTPAAHPVPASTPQPQPHQHPPRPQEQQQPQSAQRMEQVRAELDELSDLLRRDQRGDGDR
ncbi:hypothetical protein [Streptomyces sp. NPDC054887]